MRKLSKIIIIYIIYLILIEVLSFLIIIPERKIKIINEDKEIRFIDNEEIHIKSVVKYKRPKNTSSIDYFSDIGFDESLKINNVYIKDSIKEKNLIKLDRDSTKDIYYSESVKVKEISRQQGGIRKDFISVNIKNNKKRIIELEYDYHIFNKSYSNDESFLMHSSFFLFTDDYHYDNKNTSIKFIFPNYYDKDMYDVSLNYISNKNKISKNKNIFTLNTSVSTNLPEYFIGKDKKVSIVMSKFPEDDSKKHSNNMIQEAKNELSSIREKERTKYFIISEKINKFSNICYELIPIITVFISFVLIISYVVMYKKNKKHVELNYKYSRDLVNDYSPAILAMLVNKERILSKDLFAILFDLTTRGYLKFEVDEVVRRKFLFKKLELDFRFKLAEGVNLKELSDYERYLIEWLIEKIGTNNEVTLYDINLSSKELFKDYYFFSNYKYLEILVKNEFDEYCFYDEDSYLVSRFVEKSSKILGFAFIILMITNSIFFAIAFFIAKCFFEHSYFFKFRTIQGEIEYQKWMTFKKFIEDYSDFQEKEHISIYLWEKYIVYGVCLNLTTLILEDMEVNINLKTSDIHPADLFSSLRDK